MGEPLLSHPSDAELDAFVQRTSPAPVLIQTDRHLAECSQCRGRVQARAGLDAQCTWLRADLAAALPADHLSEEAIQAAALGQSSPEAAEHLRSCPACRAEIDDLRLFIAAQRSPGRPRRTRLWAAAAAVLVVASTAAIWKIVQPAGQPELVVTVRDSRGVVAVDRAGVLHTPISLPPDYTALVTQSLKTGKLDSPAMAGLARKPEFLLGDSTKQTQFALRQPVGETVATPQPEFSWTALLGATAYRVNIYDENFRGVAASPNLTSTTWMASQPLTPGQTYSWTVTARVGGRDVREPVPPAPEARFAVLAQARMDQLQAAERQYPDAHLLLAALYAQAGAFSGARRHLAALQQENPNSDLVRKLSASVAH
ncbi:MAG TPA: tetratricopeptide repeat protein [Bryobacteraceae bacterium]|nr:tetratricopeptide repeat protein [Bryobacteraceae bacterium]